MRRGQVALIVVLVVVIGVTIAVAVAGRSATTVTISSQEEERARSFSAAEAGIEDALTQGLPAIAGSGGSLAVGNSSVSYTVTKLTNITADVEPGEMVTVDWSKSDATTNSFQVSWTNGDCGSVSLVSTVITPAGGVTHAVQPASPVSFAKGVGGIVRMHFVGCRSSVTLSGQGGALSFYQVDSVGMSGESQSKVQVIRSAPASSGLLDFALFSGGTIE